MSPAVKAVLRQQYAHVMQKPKLVVFDVDGTLIGWDGHVSATTHDALANLRQLNIPIALATGRPLALGPLTLNEVGGADWMVCGNGSTLFQVSTGAMFRDNNLPIEIIEPAITSIRQQVPGIGLAIELSDAVIHEPGFDQRVPEPSQLPPVDDALAEWITDAKPVRRVMLYHDDYDSRLSELAQYVRAVIDDRCQVQEGGLPFVDFSPAGDDKAAALQVLVDHLGIDASEVIAFGDGGNDVEMLEWAGVGVAMGNARPEVQAIADAVTEHVSDRGVAAYLEPLWHSE